MSAQAQPTNFRDWLDAGPAAMLRAANTPVSSEDPFADSALPLEPVRSTAPATDAAEALMGELGDSGQPADLLARLQHFAPGEMVRFWESACRSYASLVESRWLEEGRFHESNGRPCAAAECREIREELLQIAEWEMPSTATQDETIDDAIAAE